jgi:hypothetical protein
LYLRVKASAKEALEDIKFSGGLKNTEAAEKEKLQCATRFLCLISIMKTTFKAAHVNKMPAAQRRTTLERQIDLIEQRIREKMDVSTGFADGEVKARKLEVMLKYYDSTGSGYLGYNEFFVALTKLNFVGVQREIEALFYRYDINSTGFIGYHEFAFGLFSLEGRIVLDKFASRTLEKIKNSILDNRGALGIAYYLRAVRAMDRDGNKQLPRQEVLGTIRDFVGLNASVTSTDLTHLLDSLEIAESGMISSVEFLRGFLTGMSSERKQIAANLYRQFENASTNQVFPETILSQYEVLSHPNAARGRSDPREIRAVLAQYFNSGNVAPGCVTLVDFLDFFYGISLTIDDDEDFELTVRNSWHSNVGALVGAASRRINVVSSVGLGQIDTVELRDNLTSRVWDNNSVTAKLKRSGYDSLTEIKLTGLGSLSPTPSPGFK